MSSLFKYPGQTAPVKIGPVNAQVRPANLQNKNLISPLLSRWRKTSAVKGRATENSYRDGNYFCRERGRREREIEGERRRERKGRGDEDEEGEENERERVHGRERKGARKTFLLPPLSRRKQFPSRGDARRDKEREKVRRERENVGREGERGKKKEKTAEDREREREKEEVERERERKGEEEGRKGEITL